MTGFNIRAVCLVIVMIGCMQSTAAKIIRAIHLVSPAAYVPDSYMQYFDGEPIWAKRGKLQLTPAGQRYAYATGLGICQRYNQTLFRQGLNSEAFDYWAAQTSPALQTMYSLMMGLSNRFEDFYELPFYNNDKRVQPPIEDDLFKDIEYKNALPHNFDAVGYQSALTEDIFPIVDNHCPYGKYMSSGLLRKVWSLLDSNGAREVLVYTINATRIKYEVSSKFKPVNYEGPISDLLDTCATMALYAFSDYANDEAAPINPSSEEYTLLANCYSLNQTLLLRDTSYSAYIRSPMLKLLADSIGHRRDSLAYMLLATPSTAHIVSVMIAFDVLDVECYLHDLLHKSSDRKCFKMLSQANSLLIEVHQDGDNERIPVVFFNGQEIKLCVSDHGEVCNAADLGAQMNQKTMQQYKSWCYKEIEPDSLLENPIFWKFVTFIMLFFSLLLLLLSISQLKPRKDQAALPERQSNDSMNRNKFSIIDNTMMRSVYDPMLPETWQNARTDNNDTNLLTD